ncbi:MAG: PEP-CTERM sorting domain-containing protein [Terracidiphilus sp.]|jgi:hypothetical protein
MKAQGLKTWGKYGLAVLLGLGAASALYGDSVVATYQPAGVQTPNTANLCAGTSACWVGEQTFATSSVPAPGSFPTLVSSGSVTGSISGTYSGGLQIYGADAFGGAGGSGYYPELFAAGGSYTLSLSVSGNIPGVNYFGLWFSALDAGNQLQFYDGSTLVYTFGPAQFMSLVGTCTGSNAFCGNPNNGQDSGEQFAFLNFFDTTGYFDKIVFTQTGGGGFESDNHTVAYLDPPNPSGTVINPIPEPSSFILLATGLLALIGFGRRFA